MTPYDDDINVSGNDLPDIVTMAMARRTLRGLVPEAPPAPSEQLAVVLREGLVVSGRGSGWGRLTGRLASLGLAAKLTLAAGVAVASAGGAATAVAFTHENSHHGDHPDSPRNHPGIVVPTPPAGNQADDRPEHGGPRGTVSTQQTDRHGGTSGGDDTSGDHSGSDDSTSGSHDGSSGSGSDDSTSGSTDTSGGGSTSDGDHSGSTSTTSGDSGSSGSGSSGSGSSGSDSGSGSGTDGGTSGSTSDGGTSGG